MLDLPQFGKKPRGDRQKRIEQSPNYLEGSFQNLSPTKMMAEEASYWKMIGWYTWNKQVTAPPKKIPSIKRNLKSPLEKGTKPIITWFGHSSYLLQISNINILVDPVFCGFASPFESIGAKSYDGSNEYTIEDLPSIDLVVLSHDHYDHLDYHSILKLKDHTKKFICPLGVGAHLEHWGVPTSSIEELDWWQETRFIDSLVITCTPARHFSGRGLKRNQTLWASFVLSCDGYVLFLGGDSGYDNHFTEIGNKYGPFDLAILECGQYNEYWKYIHMLPHQTLKAAIDLKTKVLLPVHWAKFTLAVHPWNESITKLHYYKEVEQSQIVIASPMIGEAMVLDSILPQSPWWK